MFQVSLIIDISLSESLFTGTLILPGGEQHFMEFHSDRLLECNLKFVIKIDYYNYYYYLTCTSCTKRLTPLAGYRKCRSAQLPLYLISCGPLETPTRLRLWKWIIYFWLLIIIASLSPSVKLFPAAAIICFHLLHYFLVHHFGRADGQAGSWWHYFLKTTRTRQKWR